MISKDFFDSFFKNISSKTFTNTIKREIGVPHVILFSPLEYFKLANIAIVQVLGSIENEQCFNSLASCKSKSFIMNSLPTKAQWLECNPISFITCIAFHMQIHFIYGMQSTMEQEPRLSSSFARLKLSNYLIINYFLWPGIWHWTTFLSAYHWLNNY